MFVGVHSYELSDDTDPKSVLYEIYRAKHENVEGLKFEMLVETTIETMIVESTSHIPLVSQVKHPGAPRRAHEQRRSSRAQRALLVGQTYTYLVHVNAVVISICSATINNAALFSNLTTVPISKEANKGTGFVELATKYGYKSESHVVTTEDGYVLTIHRIPPAAHCAKKTPLFLLPNIHMTSAGFLGIAEQSPGFLLSDDCYDVWFGNYRGNIYGQDHVRLNPAKNAQFWEFSFHESGVYDAPASIDYILETTGSQQVIFIGYAQGGTVFFIMNSEKPEYASKVSLHVSLAPLTRLLNTRSLPVIALAEVCNNFRDILYAAGVWEVLGKGFTIQGTLATLCQIDLLASIVCGASTAATDAPHPESLPPEAEKRIYQNFYTGTSVKSFSHYGQLIHSKEFVKFDYGLVENLKRYGSATPPSYNFKASDVPVVVFQGLNDGIMNVVDTDWTVDQLPNVIDYIKVKDPQWNHLDMLYSIFWKETIYLPLKQFLEQYDKSSTGFLSIAEQSPGFIFSDDCYDVWFGNLRGNEYGRKHVSLDPDKDLEFWKFHIHENGVYDVPASIDYILDNTGSEQLIYIGFSHGGGAFFVLNSEKPEYASKISLHVSLAPSTRLLNNKSLAIRTLTVTINELRLALEAAGVWELVAKGFPLQGFLATLCQIPLLAAVVCGLATAVVDAPHPGSLPPEAQKRIYSTLLSGTSVETFAHYGQLETSKKFSKFDYGLVENLKRYGSATPPEYDFKASNVPVVMFQGLNDHITDVADTDWVVEQLPNVIDYIKLEDPLWNHLDMLYSVYWKDKIYARDKPMKRRTFSQYPGLSEHMMINVPPPWEKPMYDDDMGQRQTSIIPPYSRKRSFTNVSTVCLGPERVADFHILRQIWQLLRRPCGVSDVYNTIIHTLNNYSWDRHSLEVIFGGNTTGHSPRPSGQRALFKYD
ncbi:hypothetical protein MSG28_013945 [Choristoneura fumiferana]|uniref:Uncharacterized protein n=1 Tax=Choristoneura fumiferana TaxID=7141 RepID=A0ACC0K9D1_CHOFU|nr:hypothetical protein MSG28_013945 [Choristoneura fumiferana]